MDLILGGPILLGLGILIPYTAYALVASAWDVITWPFRNDERPRRPEKRRTPPHLP